MLILTFWLLIQYGTGTPQHKLNSCRFSACISISRAHMWVTAGEVVIVEKNREASRGYASKISSICLEYEKEGQQSLPSLPII